MTAAAPFARGNFVHGLHYATLLPERGGSPIKAADSEKFRVDPNA